MSDVREGIALFVRRLTVQESPVTLISLRHAKVSSSSDAISTELECTWSRLRSGFNRISLSKFKGAVLWLSNSNPFKLLKPSTTFADCREMSLWRIKSDRRTWNHVKSFAHSPDSEMSKARTPQVDHF